MQLENQLEQNVNEHFNSDLESVVTKLAVSKLHICQNIF